MTPSEVLTPRLLNVTCVAGETEYEVELGDCQHFSVQARGDVAFRFAFATGKVATPTAPWMTCKSGQTLNSPEKLSGRLTLYVAVATADAGAVIEALVWQRWAPGV